LTLPIRKTVFVNGEPFTAPKGKIFLGYNEGWHEHDIEDVETFIEGYEDPGS
jgi:hypothetical protein